MEKNSASDKVSHNDHGESGHVHGPHCSHHHQEPYVRSTAKIGRNDPCPCGSQQKYKKCHGRQ
ncbi:MAG: SEC-C metal-binding domain-containing protein [Oligoflexus sp.]